MKRACAAALTLLLLSCEPLDRRIVTLFFDEYGERVTISATTYVASDDQRDALLAERDEWAVRFAQAHPESETVTWEREKGKLASVDRRANVAVEDLQKFFFDTPLTVTTTRGEGWLELAIYAGSSTRATGEQRRLADKLMAQYSARAVHYFDALRTLYLYLDEHPQRAVRMFTDVFSDEEERVLLSTEEHSMTQAVRDDINALVDLRDLHPNAEQILDLVYNPFPARLKIIAKGPVVAVENLNKLDSETYEVKTVSASEAVAALEGRWVSPDPLAVAYKTDLKVNAGDIAAALSAEPRRADPVVTRDEVAAAIIEKMRPAPRYRLRWFTKARPRAT